MPRSASRSRSRSRSPLSDRSRSRSRSASPRKKEDVPPFLIRVFVSRGRHTPISEYDKGQFPVRDEFQVYAWETSTPTEILRLLYPSLPAAYRALTARYTFRHIYVDATPRGLYRGNDLLAFYGRELLSAYPVEQDGMDIDENAPAGRRPRKIQEKTLDAYGFVTGDLLSVSVQLPEPKYPRLGGPGAIPGLRIGAVGPAAGAGGPPPRGGWNDPVERQGAPLPPQAGPPDAPPVGTGVDAPKWGRGDPLPPRLPMGGRGSMGPGFGPGRGGFGGGDAPGWRGTAPHQGMGRGLPRRGSPVRDEVPPTGDRRRSRSPERTKPTWAERM
ncbi:hypothetical protein IAT38_005419 [Cryptococcus sp. DSM 104549]